MKIDFQQIKKDLKFFQQQPNCEHQLFYLACLKKLSQLGKLLFKTYPNEEFKKTLINLSNYIQNYDLSQNASKISSDVGKQNNLCQKTFGI